MVELKLGKMQCKLQQMLSGCLLSKVVEGPKHLMCPCLSEVILQLVKIQLGRERN